MHLRHLVHLGTKTEALTIGASVAMVYRETRLVEETAE